VFCQCSAIRLGSEEIIKDLSELSHLKRRGNLQCWNFVEKPQLLVTLRRHIDASGPEEACSGS